MRVREFSSMQAIQMSKDGMMKGRAADGSPIQGRVGGKSLAKQIREKKESERLAKEKEQGTRKGRRRHREI